MPYQNRKRSDDDLIRMFRVGVAEGIPVSLNGKDGRLFDMYGWPSDSLKHELFGTRWLEYVDQRDLGRLLNWISLGANGETIQYRGVGPGGYECECRLCKFNGERLRLLTGVAIESNVMLPAPACMADDSPP